MNFHEYKAAYDEITQIENDVLITWYAAVIYGPNGVFPIANKSLILRFESPEDAFAYANKKIFQSGGNLSKAVVKRKIPWIV